MIEATDYIIPDSDIDQVVVVDGHQVSKGLIPRDYGKHPVGSYATGKAYDPSEIPLIPREEWSERLSDMTAQKSRLSDIRNRSGPNGAHIPALDQNGQGYCWFYSGTACVQLSRAVANMPYVPLSAHSGACVIKNFRDQGGWGAAGLEFMAERGICTQEDWPAKSMDRRYNTNDNWSRAKEFRVTESWMDLQPPAYDRDMSFDQTVACLLSRIPVIGDFNHWGHSVALMDLVEVDPTRSLSDVNRWGVRLLNSWRDSWGSVGTGILKGRKAVPDGGAAVRTMWGG